MGLERTLPRIILISQWPNVKNGEYELIEKIKQTGFKIAVVDYLGFDVDSGSCLNKPNLAKEYDFAISFHYDTPKFLNIPTYLWVANPLEFMHLRGDYRTVLLHHLRSYDDYLYNGSDTLKTHIRNVVGSEWRDTALEMFPSCSIQSLGAPKTTNAIESETNRKIFYCGVNWERGLDRAGRAQGLLDKLQDMEIADFYGPNKLEGISPWAGFKSYKYEIPFDGISMSRVMRDYGAVLAVSSPAHMRSQTSSSRVFEGIAAGVPVISDENPHVKKLFGNLVYYFRGSTEEQRALSIAEALKQILENPEEARSKVIDAQALMMKRYCFEPCFERVISAQTPHSFSSDIKTVEIFLFHHDPDPLAQNAESQNNIAYILAAAEQATLAHHVQFRILCYGEQSEFPKPPSSTDNVSFEYRQRSELTDKNWHKLRLGEKVALLSHESKGNYVTFFTQFDFPQYDYFSKALDWFTAAPIERKGGLYISGFFVNDLTKSAPSATVGILRNNASETLYRWTQNSLAEHQMATLFFDRDALSLLTAERIDRFDSILPISIIASTIAERRPLHRSRHLLLRVKYGYFHRHYDAFQRATGKGFWAQHYELVTNYNHELNALYDVHHESIAAREIADQIAGHALPPVPPIDPAIHRVNALLTRLRPIYRAYKAILRLVRR